MTFEKFKDEYEKRGKCPGQMSAPKNPFNDKQLEERWKRYCEVKSVKNKSSKDERWTEVSELVHKRDREQCRFLSKLKVDNPDKYMYFIHNNIRGLYMRLDVAHVIPRTLSKALYYEPNNLVLLNRVSHSLLDTYHDPVTGKAITSRQVEDYWKYIIGVEKYEELKENK